MGKIITLQHAVVCENSDFNLKERSFNGGVIEKNGDVCELSLHYKPSFTNIPSTNVMPVENLRGRWVFGGMLQNGHFGHFITESITRLWATNYISNVNGIVFYNRYCGQNNKSFIFDFLKLIIPNLQIKIIDKSCTVEELIVPEQLHCGNGFVNGCSENRMLFNVPTPLPKLTTSKKVYISRKNLSSTEGNIIGNEYISELLEKEGYLMIYPEQLSIEEQINIYTHAEKLVFDQGSAFHMYNLFSRKNQDVYVIWRRKKIINGYVSQYRSFAEKELNKKSHIINQYAPINHTENTAKYFGFPDFKNLYAELYELNFIKEIPNEIFISQDKLLDNLSQRIGQISTV